MTNQPTPDRPDYDQALKRIIERAPAAFLDVITPGYVWRSTLSPELPTVARQADLVWAVDFPDGMPGILHVELQTRPDPQIGERLAEYSIRLWLREHQPIISVVVFLRPSATLPTSPFVMHCLGQERLRFSFDIVRIWELPPSLVLDTAQYDLWPLAGLMRDVTLDSTVTVASRLAAAALPRQEQSELIGLLALLTGMRLPRVQLADALRRDSMIQDLLSESSFAGAVYDVGKAEGKAEGIAEGKAEGIAEGKAAGMRELLRLALTARFGPASADLLAALDSASEPTLAAIAVGLATEPLEQIRTRLGLS